MEKAIRDNMGYFGKLAQELYSKRTMTNMEIADIFNECRSKIAKDLPSYKLFGDLNVSKGGEPRAGLRKAAIRPVRASDL